VSAQPSAAASTEASTAPSTAPSAAASTAATAPLADCAKGQTTGPNGEVGVPTAQITLTADEIQKVKDGKFKAAILWHTSGDWVNAVGRGIKDTFASLGVTIVSETDAEFDAAKQASQVETVMALNPDIIITLVVDPVSGAQAYRKVIDAGKKLVLISNVPKDYVAGKDYVGVVSDDFFGIGTAAADLMGKALNGTGTVGYIFHDASY
jgi:ribose transport system substrate-binding protein